MEAAQRRTLNFTHHNIPHGSQLSTPVNPEEHLDVTVYLGPANNGLQRCIDDVVAGNRDPLTRPKYERDFGASDSDIEHMRNFSREHHLQVTQVNQAARSIVLSGSVKDLCAAFQANIGHYYVGGTTYSHRLQSGALSVPETYADIIKGVFGFDNRPNARSLCRHLGAADQALGRRSFYPNEVAQLYNFPTQSNQNNGGNQNNGAGQTIGIIELGGGYSSDQLLAYFTDLGIFPLPDVTEVSVAGGSNSPGDPQGPDGEVQLDIEVVGCVAPGAKIVVYFAPNTDQGFVDAITQAVHDTTNNPSVISISWGNAESVWNAQVCNSMDQAFQAAASMGVTICAAAGDAGSGDRARGNNVDFPASNPYVLGCGGTFLVANGNDITREIVWNDDPSTSATGGGVSQLYDLPPWQSGLRITATGELPTPLKMRGVPDVAGNADPNSGYKVSVDGNNTVIGGTSAVAPLWAGLIALLNQTLGRPLGYVNPKLYNLTAGFHDITKGNNGAYEAQKGWDACTGLGTPIFPQLLAALQSPTSRGHGPALQHQNAQNA